MAEFKRYAATYAVEGIRYFCAPIIMGNHISAAEAELSFLLRLQAIHPGRAITLGIVRRSL